MSCSPTSFDSKECDFSSLDREMFEKDTGKWPEMLFNDDGKTPFFKIPNSREFVDFLKEFPVMTLKKGTVICHAVRSEDLFETNRKPSKNMLWWNSIYPGKPQAKGASFTFRTNYGSEDTESNVFLYYKLKKEISLLFIPNIFKRYFEEESAEYYDSKDLIDKRKIDFFEERINNIQTIVLKLDNPENKIIDFVKNIFFLPKEFEGFNEGTAREYALYEERLFRSGDTEEFKNVLLDYINFIRGKMNKEIEKTILHDVNKYSGARIFRGVRGWEKKGYTKIDSYIEERKLSYHLTELGFNGYISCDGCEVFISHDVMEGLIKRPYYVQITSKDDYLRDIVDKYNTEYYPERKLKYGFENIYPEEV